jgi:hypothetical protein
VHRSIGVPWPGRDDFIATDASDPEVFPKR